MWLEDWEAGKLKARMLGARRADSLLSEFLMEETPFGCALEKHWVCKCGWTCALSANLTQMSCSQEAFLQCLVALFPISQLESMDWVSSTLMRPLSLQSMTGSHQASDDNWAALTCSGRGLCLWQHPMVAGTNWIIFNFINKANKYTEGERKQTSGIWFCPGLCYDCGWPQQKIMLSHVSKI